MRAQFEKREDEGDTKRKADEVVRLTEELGSCRKALEVKDGLMMIARTPHECCKICKIHNSFALKKPRTKDTHPQHALIQNF